MRLTYVLWRAFNACFTYGKRMLYILLYSAVITRARIAACDIGITVKYQDPYQIIGTQ